MEALQRQVDELRALTAMFPEPGEVFMDAEQEERLVQAEALLEQQGQTPAAWNGLHRWNGRVSPQGCSLEGSAVALNYHLPASYPEQQPELQVECGGNRKDLSLLTEAVQGAVREAAGSECLALCISAMVEQAASLVRDAEEARSSQAAVATELKQLCKMHIMRRLIWFHHIKSVTKRKHIVAWAAELALGGYSKPGFPGIIICEGLEEDVQEYTARLRSLKWSAMAVRADETDEGEDAYVDGRRDEKQAGSKGARCFPVEFHELDEGGMSQLSAACDAAGLRELFLAAMKL